MVKRKTRAQFQLYTRHTLCNAPPRYEEEAFFAVHRPALFAAFHWLYDDITNLTPSTQSATCGGLYPFEVALDTTEHPFERELCSRTFLLAPEFPHAADAYAEEPMGDLIPFPRKEHVNYRFSRLHDNSIPEPRPGSRLSRPYQLQTSTNRGIDSAPRSKPPKSNARFRRDRPALCPCTRAAGRTLPVELCGQTRRVHFGYTHTPVDFFLLARRQDLPRSGTRCSQQSCREALHECPVCSQQSRCRIEDCGVAICHLGGERQ